MDNFWMLCLAHFQERLNTQQYNTWIKPLRAEALKGGLCIKAPSRFVAAYVKERFLSEISHLAEAHLASPANISIEIAEAAKLPLANTPSKASGGTPRISPETSKPPGAVSKVESRLNPLLNFTSFVPGKANELARAVGLQIAENPGKSYNPLFVYGGVGLGKTHLIHAIGNQMLALNPQAKICYVHAERYVSDMVRAFRNKAFDDFKGKYDNLDLLMVDDIQFFAGKDRTQEEFFYTFNNLIESGKQVILTSDAFPKDMEGIEERLKSRFAWGLTVLLEPPDSEMRVAILMNKALQDHIKLNQDIAFFIAKQVRSNVRELEGALKRVIAYSKFNEKPLSVELAKEALKDLIAAQGRQVGIENIQKIVADYYKLKTSDLFSPKRTQAIARPRQIAMHLAKELTNLSYTEIGNAFGGRDHTTVLYALRRVEELRTTDNNLRRDYALLAQVLTG
jgi:chromosomal replication initiator protein